MRLKYSSGIFNSPSFGCVFQPLRSLHVDPRVPSPIRDPSCNHPTTGRIAGGIRNQPLECVRGAQQTEIGATVTLYWWQVGNPPKKTTTTTNMREMSDDLPTAWTAMVRLWNLFLYPSLLSKFSNCLEISHSHPVASLAFAPLPSVLICSSLNH